jgi:hypothetical protein
MSMTELEGLMNEVVPLAQEMLAQHGEFDPYGGVLTNEGKIHHYALGDQDEDATAQSVLAQLIAGFRDGVSQGLYRATAIILDVRATLPDTEAETDAIYAALEHEAGLSVDVLIPYSIDDSGSVDYGDAVAAEGEAKVFSD